MPQRRNLCTKKAGPFKGARFNHAGRSSILFVGKESVHVERSLPTWHRLLCNSVRTRSSRSTRWNSDVFPRFLSY